MLKKYFWNILISLDQLFNTVLFGDPDETISSRLGKWLEYPTTSTRYKFAEFTCKFLHMIDKNHCRKSVEPDEGKNGIID